MELHNFDRTLLSIIANEPHSGWEIAKKISGKTGREFKKEYRRVLNRLKYFREIGVIDYEVTQSEKNSWCFYYFFILKQNSKTNA